MMLRGQERGGLKTLNGFGSMVTLTRESLVGD